jgi:MSHA biogenesis protein MshJ
MSSLQATLQQLGDWFAAKNPRERLLLGVAAIAVLVTVSDMLLLRPAIERRATVESEVIGLREQLERARSQAAELEGALSVDPDADSRAAEATLRGELRRIDERLGARMSGLTDPAQMTRLLQSLLERDGELELLRLESLPAEPLSESEEAEPRQDRPQVFRHPVEIELRGDYMSTLRYLRAVEGLPQRLFWDGLEYRVEEYPQAVIRLRLYSLSGQEAWLGV